MRAAAERDDPDERGLFTRSVIRSGFGNTNIQKAPHPDVRMSSPIGCGPLANLVRLSILGETDTTEGVNSAGFDVLLSKKRRSQRDAGVKSVRRRCSAQVARE